MANRFAVTQIPESAGTGASPGFSFGRSGNATSGTYLLNESVPSNITGRPVDLTNGRITQVSVANQDVNTFEIEVEEHDGITFTSLGVFQVLSSRKGKFSDLDIPITADKEIAVKIATGSAKNIIVSIYVKGDAV